MRLLISKFSLKMVETVSMSLSLDDTIGVLRFAGDEIPN